MTFAQCWPRSRGNDTGMNLPRMLATIVALTFCASADAQLFRTYLASDGNDANACTLVAPCRLLPRALTTVADGGEIWMLDSANFNTGQVEVTKSVTILAIPGALGSVVATGGGHGLNIDTGGVKVTLRNLVLKHLTSSIHGINFAQGAELNIAECEIVGMGSFGIHATAPGSKVTIQDTAFRNNSTDGIRLFGTVTASLDRVHISGSFHGVFNHDGARITISNSVVSGNQYGISVSNSAGVTRAAIEGTTVTGNTDTGIDAYAGAGATEVTVSRSSLSHNNNGVKTYQNAGSTVNVVLDGNTITENVKGIVFSAGGTIFTRGSNTLKFNGPAGTDDVVGGTLTSLAGQ